MRLATANTEMPGNVRLTSGSQKHVDFTGMPGEALRILKNEHSAGLLDQPRVSDRKKLMSNSDTRVSVIFGVCQGDADRWREFDAIYRPMLFGFLRGQGLSDFDADEVVQDIFFKLLHKLKTYDRKKQRFRTWLFTVAHNALIDKARRRATYQKAVAGWVENVLRTATSDSSKLAGDWIRHHRKRILAHALKTVRAPNFVPRLEVLREARLARPPGRRDRC